jgi:hypothetical protein
VPAKAGALGMTFARSCTLTGVARIDALDGYNPGNGGRGSGRSYDIGIGLTYQGTVWPW